MRNVKDVRILAPRDANEEDPAFLILTPEERKAKLELQDVEALRFFTTTNGKTLVCLITDRKLYVKTLLNGPEEGGIIA